MILHNGETIYLSFCSANYYEEPKAWVTEAVVLDAEHKVVLEKPLGRARVVVPVEGIHQCEAAAWAACSTKLAEFAAVLRVKADECAQRAAKLSITREAVA